MKPVCSGLKHTERVWAGPSDLASAIGNTGVDVVSSPATIGYLEMACHNATHHLFEEGEASVGVNFNMAHVGAALPDKPIELSVDLIKVDGNRLTFSVLATQASKPIMKGTHERAVINLQRLLSGITNSRNEGNPLMLTGRSLTVADIIDVADGGRKVEISSSCEQAIQQGRAVVERYFDEGIAAYGLTTGLGLRATEMLSREQAADFSIRTVRARAQAVGPLLPDSAVRAAMLVRLNTLLSGEAGASAHIAGALADALNASFTPAMAATGSIGAGDLVVMAALPLALAGEGDALVDGKRVPAATALDTCGLAAVQLGPKDGLVLCNNTAHSVSMACLAAHKARTLLKAADMSVAMVMEGFRANLSPVLIPAATMRPQPGQVETATRLRHYLEGSGLFDEGAARRLQDPVSIRSSIQTNGSLQAALEILETALTVEINHAPDNPVVFLDEGRIVSTGNYHTPWLTQALDLVARAMAAVATDMVSRMHRLCSAEMSDLPPLLSSSATDRAGFGPLLKPIEALRANILHLSNSTPILPSHNANGVEDAATFTPLAATKLLQLCEQMGYLTSYALIAGAQAIDLARPDRVAPRVMAAHALVREHSLFIEDDRPLGREVEVIACELVLMGGLGTSYL
ncbi:MAG: aromatic amino acid lyase [Anderseniella sp.]